MTKEGSPCPKIPPDPASCRAEGSDGHWACGLRKASSQEPGGALCGSPGTLRRGTAFLHRSFTRLVAPSGESQSRHGPAGTLWAMLGLAPPRFPTAGPELTQKMVVAVGPLAPPIVLLGADQIALGVSLASAGNGREVTAAQGPLGWHPHRSLWGSRPGRGGRHGGAVGPSRPEQCPALMPPAQLPSMAPCLCPLLCQ